MALDEPRPPFMLRKMGFSLKILIYFALVDEFSPITKIYFSNLQNTLLAE